MEEYQLTPDELIAKDFRMIRSSRRGFYPHGKSDWIDAIKKIHQQGESVFAGDLQDKHPYLYNQGVWIFGDWDKALRAAGFDPKRMRLRTFWDKRKIIDELQRMQKQSLPLYPNYVMKNHQKLFSGALRQYGAWNKALIAAGLINQEVPRKLYNSRLAILRALRDSLERRSKDDIPQALRLRAAHYFGSLRNALLALRKDQRFLRGWSKQKIILILSRMHRSKESLGHGRIRREIPALLSAAEAYFGSWGKALFAAGIDPNLYFVRHRWRKRKTSDKRTPAKL
jgi:hypothetical protein